MGIIIAGLILSCILCLCFYCFCCRGGRRDNNELVDHLSPSTTDNTDGTYTDYSGNYNTDYTTDYTNTTKTWDSPFILMKNFESKNAGKNNNTSKNTVAATNNDASNPVQQLTLDGEGLLPVYRPVISDNLSPVSSNSTDDVLKSRS